MPREPISLLREGLAEGETLPLGVREVEGIAMRLVRAADGSGRAETWDGPEKGWRLGADLSAFMDAPEADISFLRQIGICGTPSDIPHQMRLRAWLQRRLGP